METISATGADRTERLAVIPVRPSGMDGAGEHLWRRGDGTGDARGRGECLGDPPVPGDLWVLTAGDPDFGAWDLAFVLIHRVAEDGRYVLCAPVTSTSIPADASGLRLTDSPLGVPLTWWPVLETGVDYATLGRRIGTGVDAFTLTRVLNWVRNDCAGKRSFADVAPAPLPQGPIDAPSAERYIAELCRIMTDACEQNGAA